MLPKVAIVILNWNNAPDTLRCLASVQALDYPNYHVVVVDNSSTDGSADRIRASYPMAKILKLEINSGYAGGNNAGIRYALQGECEYVLLLNNDTLVAPGMLTELVQVAESHPEVGMLGPTVYCVDPADTLFAAGSFVQWAKGAICHRGMFQPAALCADLEHLTPVDFVVGCGVLVRKQLIEVAGVLEPAYYMNFEDVEWGVRARRHGFEVWYVPQAMDSRGTRPKGSSTGA